MTKENYQKLKAHYGESKAKNLMYKWRKGLHKVEKLRELLTVCGYECFTYEWWGNEETKHAIYLK